MSKLSVKGQESKAVPCCHDHPPQYDSYRESQDLLTSIIENEHTKRKSVQRIKELDREVVKFLKKLKKTKKLLKTPGWNLRAEFYEELGQAVAELAQIIATMANVCKERAVHNTDLYKVLSKLNDDEIKRMYDSVKQDPNRQIRNEILGQFIPSDTTNVSKTADDATAKPPVSFWKRIFKHSARP